MEKESYSIDDILSEVKKRRESESKNTPNYEIKSKAEKKAEPEIKEKAEKKPEPVFEAKTQPEPEQEAEIQIEAETEPVVKPDSEEQPAAAPEAEDNEEKYVDLLTMVQEENISAETQPQKNEEKEKTAFFKTKKGRIFKWIIIVLVLVIAAGGIFAGFYINNALNKISDNDDNTTNEQPAWAGMAQLIENYPEITETQASQLSSLQDMIKTWYYNGAPCSSSHVLNVLLIGEDTRGTEILDDETRADSAIIVSVNIDTKQITLTSVMRDTYGYWENTPGDPSTGEFGKINEAMLGGINNYINCIEKLYKVDIDNYVIVNFESFESIIDTLGGVNIEITSAEINEINNYQERYGYVTIDKDFEGNSGIMRLTGEQALAYCRIRYLDSDEVRADRQKTCLYEIFNEVKGSSTVNQLKVVNSLLPYVKTGFRSSEVVSIAKYALSQGWLNYDINMITVPYTKTGGDFYGAWHWKTDFPQDANYLQTMLYGKSTITLAEQRVDYKNCNLYGFYEENLIPCYATVTNYNYGEATTYEMPTKEDTSTTE